MDLNDEVYNPACSEADHMSQTMDSDYVPDPTQYGLKYTG